MVQKDRTRRREYEKNYRAEHKQELAEYHKDYRAKHPEVWQRAHQKYEAAHKSKLMAYRQRYYSLNKERLQRLNRENYVRKMTELRAKVFEIHGQKCSCCGEAHQLFLVLHHVNGNGADERAGKKFVEIWARAVAVPEEYKVLCWNCHKGVHLNGGVCPHNQLKKVSS